MTEAPLPSPAAPENPSGLELETLRQQAFLRLSQGRMAEALEAFLRALEASPADGELHQWAGTLFANEGRFTEARNHLEKALVTRGGDAALWCSYGLTLEQLDDRAAAEAAFRRAITLDPRNMAPVMVLAQFYADAGRIPETAPLLRKVLDLEPGHPGAVSGYLATGLYDPELTAPELAQVHRAWCATMEAKVPPLPPSPRESGPARRLRVAYLSADFRTHSCAAFIEPLLRAHDRSKVEVRLYHTARTRDARTAIFEGLADQFEDVARLDDRALAEKLRIAGIDVLVELSGHSAFNRLPVLAWRPAPVQLEWLGYPFTTGYTRLEGRITDSRVDPPGNEAFGSEPLLRLDPCYLCWQPPASSPDPAPPPSLAGEPFTFGSFNHFAKLNGAVVETWAALLRKVPGSRLLLKGKGAADPVLRERLVNGFSALGVAADRILMSGFTADARDHFEQYGRVDVALDPFPYNGVTTTLEALWMGVPVVALEGPHSIARQGLALLGQMDLGELVAPDPGAYLDIAAALAADQERLTRLRASLRDRLLASPVCDAEGFARRMESLYTALLAKAQASAPNGPVQP